MVLPHDAAGRGSGGRGAFRRRLVDTRASGVALVVLLLVLWEISARYRLVESENWPPLSDVLAALWVGIASGELIVITGSSLARMFAGYLIGGAAGAAFGILMARIRLVRRMLEPSVELIRPLPAVAVIPPLIFLLGVDDTFKIAIVIFAVFFPVLVVTMSGAMAVDKVYVQVARTFGIGRRDILWRVILPATMPYLMAGLRVSLAIALIVTVVAEMTAGSDGIGYHLMTMQYALRAPDMYAAILALAIVGYGLNQAFLAIEARAIHWARRPDTP